MQSYRSTESIAVSGASSTELQPDPFFVEAIIRVCMMAY